MALIKKLLERFNGLHYPQEYLCFAKSSFQPILHAYLVKNGRDIKDITAIHLFTGYSPVIFTLSFARDAEEASLSLIEIIFSHSSLKTYEELPSGVALAGLSMKKVHQLQLADETLCFYEGIHGWHHFLSGLQQLAGQIHNRLYKRKPGNVFLAGNLHKQVQIAYSVPRKISLITVGQGDIYNHFPTDLHGAINEYFYVISLRHEGKACQQVETAGRIALSDVDAQARGKVFGLGKNHMQPMKERAAFDFSAASSAQFQLPLPGDLIGYIELELLSSFVQGIHKILLFKIIGRHEINSDTGTLAHIHNSYASWRYKKRMESNYIFR